MLERANKMEQNIQRVTSVPQSGYPYVCMVTNRIWTFQWICIYTANFGSIQLSATVVAMNMIQFIFMIPFGFSKTLNQLVGQSIGNDDKENGKWLLLIQLFNIASLELIFIIPSFFFLKDE